MSSQQQSHTNHPSRKRIAIISGGTAANSLVSVFSSLSPYISYILPISDNGGSTSEIIRVVGGPAIGDVRSRITRLIPEESEALRAILSHRLSEDSHIAKAEWAEIIEGTHPLWYPVQPQCKELIRPFFVHVHVELLKRSRPGREFRFEKANVGNLFLTGARLFCGTLDPAIELFLRVTLVPSTIAVLPALNTNFSHHISAQLENGVVITGQSQISHPSNHLTPVKDLAPVHPSLDFQAYSDDPTHLHIPSNLRNSESSHSISSLSFKSQNQFLHEDGHSHPKSQPSQLASLSISSFNSKSASDLSALNTASHTPDNDQEDAHLPFSHPDLKISQLHFHKGPAAPLISPIKRVYYINPYGQEIHPRASSRVIYSLEQSDIIIYSIGSLFTSTIPVVILQGFSSAIQDNDVISNKKKILLFNGSKDRETDTLTCLGFIRALIGACLYSQLGSNNGLYMNHNFSSSSVALHNTTTNSGTDYKHSPRHKDLSVANYATTSAHAQDILMRPTPRLAKTYSTGLPSHVHATLTAEQRHDEHGEGELGYTASHTPLHLEVPSPASGISNAWVAQDSDIDDAYNLDKINQAVWSKYITHIVYLKDSQLCPKSDELEELSSRDIKCYEMSAIYDSKDDTRKSPMYDANLLKEVLLDVIYN